ncbi:XdhC family protein [Devosia sp.]|uniref:XdhC family protein n=1 Tax=Devosia sp. TaxID=1871048 RepID=UPI002613FA9D|nr:XdhC family protein [Devosia sp.]
MASATAGMSRDAAAIAFLAHARSQGIDGALITISGIDGGGPRALGTHMAVLADGRHLGHLSGGCVEPAIAAEVAPLIAAGTDRVMRFGKGSPFIDIRFPCGGGVDLLVHVSPSLELLNEALECLGRREPFALGFDPGQSRASRIADVGAATGWHDGMFVRRYLPRTRLLLAGRGPDFEVMARVAAAAEFDLCLATPDESSALALASLDVPIELLKSPGRTPDLPIDAWTATVLLFHEHEWEHAILAHAGAAGGFYVGALGSVRTHQQRRERLAAMGLPAAQIERIRGPIGLVDRAREPGMLAVSVLAEISAARAQLDRA